MFGDFRDVDCMLILCLQGQDQGFGLWFLDRFSSVTGGLLRIWGPSAINP